MHRSLSGFVLSTFSIAVIPLLVSADIPRTPSGKPDLTGTYDVATLTPLERPEEYGDKAYLSKEEADAIRIKRATDSAAANSASNPDSIAPPPGGDGSPGAAGNVGGYNAFWLDFGDEQATLDGKYPTSIITQPANGRQPPRTAAGMGAGQRSDSYSKKIPATPGGWVRQVLDRTTIWKCGQMLSDACLASVQPAVPQCCRRDTTT